MDEGERVWDKRGGPGWFPKGPRLVAALAVGVIVLGAVSIPIFATSNKPRRQGANQPSTTPSLSSITPSQTESPPRPQGRPIGVLAFKTANGTEVDSIDDDGVRRACFRGSKDLSIEQVIAGRIYFTDGDLFLITPRCGTRTLVVSLRNLLKRKPVRDDRIDCVSLSPDRKRIAFDIEDSLTGKTQLWTAAADGGQPRRRASDGACVNPIGWADNTHYLVQPFSDVEPYAVDASTGETLFLRNAEMWEGSLSPDGRSAVYQMATGGDINGVYVLDRQTGARRRLDLGDYSPPEITSFTWNPSSTRIMLSGAEGNYLLYSRTGLRLGRANPPVTGPDSSLPVWFDNTHAWIVIGSRVVVFEVDSARITIDFTIENVDLSSGDPVLYLESGDTGILQREPSLQKGPGPEIKITDGIYTRTAPGWRVRACPGGCSEGPYSFGPQLTQSSTMGTPCGPGEGFLFGWTPDSVSRVRSRLLHAWGADRPGHSDPNSSNYAAVVQKTLAIDGRQFAFLQASFYECAAWVAFARVGTRTILIDLPLSGLDLPANKVVIDTLRFVD